MLTFVRPAALTLLLALLVSVVLPLWNSADAATYLVSPKGAAIDGRGDGSAAHPFATVSEAVYSNRLQGGDRLIVADGDYGALNLRGKSFDPPLEVVAQNRHQPRFEKIALGGASGYVFRGLSVWPSEAPYKAYPLISTNKDSHYVRFEDMDLRARADAPETYMNWEVHNWLKAWRVHGAILDGRHNVLSHSKITATAFPITIGGAHSQALNNHVLGFSGDGIRGLGDHSVYRGNRVENCFQIDKNHDDGFQSWSRHKDEQGRKAVTGLVIEKNQIYEWTGPANHPLRCSLQGIGMFDGYFINPIIRDNLVVVSHYHGISLYAGLNGLIESNTVVQALGTTAKHPWIMIGEKKSNGYKSKGNQVRGNLAMTYKNIANPLRQNAVILRPLREFVDLPNMDLRLKPDSALRTTRGLRPDGWLP